MGYYGRLEDKIRAQELRKQGLSYGEILQEVKVSKASLSLWLKDIKLTDRQKKRLLKMKSLGQHKGSIIAADNKRQARIARTKTIYKEAKNLVGRLNKRDRFITGIALYAGEGSKTDGRAVFTNSEEQFGCMMVLMRKLRSSIGRN